MFTSAAAWVFLGGFLMLAGGFFVLGIASDGTASLRSVLPNWTVLFVFAAPLVTMHAFARERRDGTLDLLDTLPIRSPVLVVGKWLAAWTVLVGLLFLTLPLAASLWLYGDPDLPVMATTYLGLVVCSGLFAAVGILASAATSDVTVAAVLTLLVLVPLWVAGAAVSLGLGFDGTWMRAWSLGHHLHSFSVGVLDAGDCCWFLGGTVASLWMAWRTLEARRWA